MSFSEINIFTRIFTDEIGHKSCGDDLSFSRVSVRYAGESTSHFKYSWNN